MGRLEQFFRLGDLFMHFWSEFDLNAKNKNFAMLQQI